MCNSLQSGLRNQRPAAPALWLLKAIPVGRTMTTRRAPAMKSAILALVATLTLWRREADAFGVGMTTTTMGMGNSFGRLFRISTWGESHGGGVGVNLDGCPPKIPLTADDIQVGACFSFAYVVRWVALGGKILHDMSCCKPPLDAGRK